MFYWMGAIDFLFMYYANRFGTQAQLDPVTGEIVSPAGIPDTSVHIRVLGHDDDAVPVLHCQRLQFPDWWQRLFFGKHKKEIAARPMTRHTSIVAFMEVITMLWTCYLVLMFCYDDVFLGENHPVTLLVGVGCFIGSFFIFAKQLRLSAWGANIRMAIATVIVFWTPIEILGRMDLLSEIWVDPMGHKTEMIIILAAFLVLAVYLWYMGAKKKNAVSQ